MAEGKHKAVAKVRKGKRGLSEKLPLAQRQRIGRLLVKKVREEYKKLGFEDDQAFIRAIGAKRTRLTDILAGSLPDVFAAWELATYLKVNVHRLIGDYSSLPNSLPLSGSTGSGDMWAHVTPTTEKQEISLKLFEEALEAIEITTDEVPGYRKGDVAAGPKYFGNQLDAVIGLECIVQTSDGVRRLMQVNRGTKPGHFTLTCARPGAAPIENVRIEWAAPVKVVFRSPNR